MSNYYEALRKIRSSGKLKKPKSKIRSRGEINLEDLIREAETLDAKGKLSERDFNRMQEIRNEVSNRLLNDKISVEDMVNDAVSDLNTRPTKTRYTYNNKKEKEVIDKPLNQFAGTMSPVELDEYINAGKYVDNIFDTFLKKKTKIKDKKISSAKDVNRKKTRWDPIAQEETDLLSKYAKEDSLEKGRNLLRDDFAVRNAKTNDLLKQTYEEGFWDPVNREAIFNEVDDIAKEREDIIKMIKGDISGLVGNPKFANDPMVREAFETYLHEKGFPIDKLDQLNRETGGSIVSREVLSDREKMLRLLEDTEAQTGIDKMFAAKPVDDVSAVGGVLDETPAEMGGMSQIGRRQMTDDIKNRLVAYRTRNGEVTGVNIDDVLLNPYLSVKDLSKSKRVSDYIKKEAGRLKREQNIRPGVDIKPLKDVHPGPKWTPMRDVLIKKDRSELLEEAINDRYGSVDNLRKINSDVSEGAEHIVDEANSLLNAYDDAIDAERRWIDLEDNRHAESIADLFENPAVIDRRNLVPISRDFGGETLKIREGANKAREDELRFIAEAAADKNLALSTKDREEILWLIRNRNSTRAERRNISPVETLDKILNEIVMRRANR